MEESDRGAQEVSFSFSRLTFIYTLNPLFRLSEMMLNLLEIFLASGVPASLRNIPDKHLVTTLSPRAPKPFWLQPGNSYLSPDVNVMARADPGTAVALNVCG
jgi:hypothetical protein